MLSCPCKPRCTVDVISPLIIWLHPLKHLPCNILSFSPIDPDLSAFFSVSLFLRGPHSSLFSCRVYIPVQSASPRGGWLYLSSVAEPLSRGWSRLHDSSIWSAPLKYGFFFIFWEKSSTHYSIHTAPGYASTVIIKYISLAICKYGIFKMSFIYIWNVSLIQSVTDCISLVKWINN